jgi:hypothetical protein
MSKIVFILGAGASVHSGTPLMDNFLEAAQDLLRNGEVEEAESEFKKVFYAIGQLHAVQSKAVINTYNIEDVYAAFEMGKLLGRLPGIEEDNELEELTSCIKKVIGYTLEKSMKLNRALETDAPKDYYTFSGIIQQLLKNKIECSIITFNYDLGIEYSLWKRNIIVNYGLEEIGNGEKYITCLKLHGSLNWGICKDKDCKKIIPYTDFNKTEYKISSSIGILPVISKLKNLKCPHCDNSLEENPFIVPPTWNKTSYHEQIEQVWKNAASELQDAEHIFILGYSFPINDMFFRYLFALGVDMTTILRGFYVYNPDQLVQDRFEALLSSGVLQKFHYYPIKFEDAVKISVPPELGISIKTIPQILNIQNQGSNVTQSYVPRGRS